MRKCLKCGDTASEVHLSVCQSCHEINVQADFVELFKENLAKFLFENISDMTRVLESSNRFIRKIESLGSSLEPVYIDFKESFVRFYRAIDLLQREIVKIFNPQSDVDLLIAINAAGVEEMCKLGELLEQWNALYPTTEEFLSRK